MIVNYYYNLYYIIIYYYILLIMATNPELSNFLSLILELRSLVKFHPLWKYITGIALNEYIKLRYQNNSILFKIIEEDEIKIIYSVKIFINEIEYEDSEEFYMSISFVNQKIEISQHTFYVDPLEGEDDEKENEENTIDCNDQYISISKLLKKNSEICNDIVELEWWN